MTQKDPTRGNIHEWGPSSGMLTALQQISRRLSH